jgi:hypothetical protein
VEPLDHLLPQAQPAPRSSIGGDGSGSLFSNGAAGGSVARGSSGSEQGLSAEELKKEKLRAQNRQKQQRYRERQRVRGWGSVLTRSRASTTWVLRPALRLEIGSLSIIFCRRRRRSRLRSRWKARQLTWSGSGPPTTRCGWPPRRWRRCRRRRTRRWLCWSKPPAMTPAPGSGCGPCRWIHLRMPSQACTASPAVHLWGTPE